jgi:hypothetical protein
MRKKDKPKEERGPEPVGIVISGGPVRETPPLISAYVWGSAPERERTTSKTRAA